ncbi:hypothetical protein LJR129_005023 [Acidovorax sp. LjRoot129]|uniref:hypothetical protein n=1 Tax=unclassified Acidovorax TaxID=2684926 RepID=UPI003ECC98A8
MYFTQKAVPNTKEGIAAFLSGHPRYSTNSSINTITTYSHNVKLHRLGLTRTECDKAESIMSVDDYWDELNIPLRSFQKDMNGAYQILPQGRQHGHLVLFEAEVYDPGYKSTCTRCGQLNYQAVTSSACLCGVCRAPRTNLKKPLLWSRTLGSGIDHGVSREEMLDWSMDKLRNRLDLVRSFDEACDTTRLAFIQLLNEFMMVEQTVMIPQKVRRLERIV